MRVQAKEALGDFGEAFTQKAMHAVELTQKALREGYECVVAVGGDGTISEVVNGFFADGKALNPQAALGVIPRGTGGDFRKTFGWQVDDAQAMARLKTDATRPLDVGLVEFQEPSGKQARRYFVNICSFGVSGQVDHEVNHASKALGGKLSFTWASVKALLKYSDKKVRLSLDDKPAEEVQVTTLAVANGRYFGGGMCVAPQADPSDGIFDVTLWTGYRLSDFVFKRGAIYDGSHVKFPGTRQMRCKKLRAEAADEVLIDADGEQPGRLPCTMTLLPSAIRLKV
jgi:YegS/Rv2252/BmrU family lipid kinase